jgi:DnaA family protein
VSTQLALPFALAPHARFATFFAGSNAALVNHLRRAASEVVWICGPPGSGKSHLLQAACAERDRDRAMYLPLAGYEDLRPEVLDGLDGLDIVALDDVDEVASSAEWNRALFGLFEGINSQGGTLLLAAAQPPAATDFDLPDLASRAAAASVYQLKSLDDVERLSALQLHAAARGLELSEAAGDYLLTRVSRDMAGLCRWLETLDEASLVTQRKLTIALIRETLAKHAGA